MLKPKVVKFVEYVENVKYFIGGKFAQFESSESHLHTLMQKYNKYFNDYISSAVIVTWNEKEC